MKRTKQIKSYLISSVLLMFSTILNAQWQPITNNNTWYLGTGNVGIGTNAPQTPLHTMQNLILGATVPSSIALTREEANVGGYLMSVNDYFNRENNISTWASVSYIRGISVDGSFLTPTTLRSWIKQKPAEGKIEFGDIGTTIMSVGNNVGTGTTNPSSQLDVSGGIAIGSGSVSANTTKMYLRNPAGKTWAISSGTNNVAEANFSIYNWSDHGTELTPVPYFNITQVGNVGIGTFTPAQALDVEKNADYQLRLGNTGGLGYNIGRNGTTGYLTFYGDQSTHTGYTFGGVDGTRMTIDASGNMGIGTTSPGAKLDVAGNARVTNDFTVSGSGTDIGGSINILNTSKTGTGQASRWTMYNMSGTYGNSLQFWAYDNIGCTSGGMCASRLTLMDNGNIIASGKIGIGLSDAATKLAASPSDELLTVNGTIHATEVKVDLTGSLADFVFHPSYKLMPLNQVEQYVKTNSHLPEIPSAAEVSKNGLSMGEMQNKLLQKVEELTLYVIEQEKTNEQQSAKIEELEKKLNR